MKGTVALLVALGFAGAASGALTMCLFAVAVRDAHEPVLQARAIVIALVGGFAGGACGIAVAITWPRDGDHS